MSSLYHEDASADALSLALLGKFHSKDSATYIGSSRTSDASSSDGDNHRLPNIRAVDDDDSKTCCTQLLRSAVAVLIAAAGAAMSITSFVYVSDYPLSSCILVYIMGGVCLLNSVTMVKNEKSFLFTLPASRKELIKLLQTKKSLEGKINSLAKEVEILRPIAARCEESDVKLRRISSAQSFNVDEIVQLVRENEETLDLIRENLRQKVIEDVVTVLISDHDNTQAIDDVTAKSLTGKIKVKTEDHGIKFDEEKCLHAMAMNTTIWGGISTVKRLLPWTREECEMINEDDIFDMFYLPNNDQRQIGSVHAARAVLAGTQTSLAPITCNMRKQHTNTTDDWNGSCSSDNDIPKGPKNRLREQLHQFRTMSLPYFRETRKGPCLFGILVILTLANSGINVYFSYIIRDFYTALSEKEIEQFYRVLYRFIISMAALIPLQVMYRFVRVKLEISWREWLTGRVLKLYFSNKVYYGLERQSKSDGASAKEYEDRKKIMDNPDQRIQEDVSSFTSYSLFFFLSIANAIVDLISFSVILFSIMPRLIIAIILFASLGTIATVLIGRVLVKLQYESLQREADFRFSLVRIRENCESIAFYGGEKVEKRETKRKFNRVIDNMTLINYAMLRLDFFTTTYNHLVNILPIFILAQQYFAGLIEFGVILQVRQAFWHIVGDLSLIVNQFNDVAAFMAGIDRLFLFMKAIQELDSDRTTEDTNILKGTLIPERVVAETPPHCILVKERGAFGPSSPRASLQQHPPAILTMRNLRLTTLDHKRVLIQNLNISLTRGQNLLITGVSGAGKTSLLRAIAGLWSSGNGEIVRPGSVYFLPQRPYCPTGTLRDQLLYPSTELGDDNDLQPSPVDQWTAVGASWSDQDLLNILASVDLSDLARRAGDGDPSLGMSAVLDWSNTLSLGEQQRLAFGRLLVNRPQLVVMDESTSALDVVAEKKMYMLLKESLASDTGDPATYVSVGHRPTLLSYHDLKLLLQDGSGYASFIPKEATGTVD